MKAIQFTKNNTWKDFDFSEIQSLQETIIKDISKKHEIWIEETIRKFAYPKIRGKITAKKLKQRNIVLNNCPGFVNATYWITQDGKQIGDRFVIKFIKSRLSLIW